MKEAINKRQSQYILFIDELGTANVKDLKSSLYILAGCSINEDERKNIKIWADQIKFKYWGHADIVFHSREIGRKENNFKIFSDKKTFDSFLKDLEEFLLYSRYRMFFIVVDKEKASKLGWNHIKIYRETSNLIVKNFLCILLTGDSKGKIVIESATAEKDFYFHKALSFYLAAGIPKVKVNYKKIQETLTSISFVTKNNFDIEEQIADLLAYAVKCRYLDKKGIKFKKSLYEEIILKVLNRKLFCIPKDAKEEKMKYFKEVNPIEILPL